MDSSPTRPAPVQSDTEQAFAAIAAAEGAPAGRSDRWAPVPEWLTRAVTPRAVTVWAALWTRCDFTSRDVTAYHRTIADWVGVSVPTVKRALDDLRAVGAVSWTQQPVAGTVRNGPNRYVLSTEPDPQGVVQRRPRGRSPVTPRQVTSDRGAGQKRPRKRQTSSKASTDLSADVESTTPAPVLDEAPAAATAATPEDYTGVDLTARSRVAHQARKVIAREMTTGYYDWILRTTGAPPAEPFPAIAGIIAPLLQSYDRARISRGLRGLRAHRPPKPITRQTLLNEIQGLNPAPRGQQTGTVTTSRQNDGWIDAATEAARANTKAIQ